MTGLPIGFRRLWGASAISNLGDGIRTTALPLLATELTHDARLIAGVAIAERLPWLVFILPGGAWADRYDRRSLRVVLDTVRAVIVAGLAVLVATGQASMAAIFVVAATLASAESIVDSSSMALVPSLVAEDDLERCGGLLTATEISFGEMIGPPVGGLLFATALWIPFVVDAASFAVAAAVAATIIGSFRPAQPPAARRTMRGDIAAGFRWLNGQRLIRTLAVISLALGTAGTMATAVLVLFARVDLGLGPIGFGVLLLAPALGGLLGAVTGPRLRGAPLATVLTGSTLAVGVAAIGIGLVPHVVVVAVLLAVQAASIVIWNVITLALRQRLIPNELLGRVGASYRFIVFAGMPVGAFIGGQLGESIGVPETFLVSGALLVAIAAVVPLAITRSR